MYNFSKHIPHSNQLFTIAALLGYLFERIKKIAIIFGKTLAFSE